MKIFALAAALLIAACAPPAETMDDVIERAQVMRTCPDGWTKVGVDPKTHRLVWATGGFASYSSGYLPNGMTPAEFC